MLKFNESRTWILLFSIFFRVFRSAYCRFLQNGPVKAQRYPFFFHDSNIKFYSRGNEWSSIQFGTCCLIYYSAFKGEYPCLVTSLGLLQGVCLILLTFIRVTKKFKELACLFKNVCFPRRSSVDPTDAIQKQSYWKKLARSRERVNQYRNVDRCYYFISEMRLIAYKY